jgi:DNA-binding beta-propeller fold protein YncE
VGVKFSPDGKSLYVVDIGAIAAAPAGFGPFVRAFPGSGVVWRITPAGQAPTGPPAGLSPLPPKSPLADAPSAPAGHAVVAGH